MTAQKSAVWLLQVSCSSSRFLLKVTYRHMSIKILFLTCSGGIFLTMENKFLKKIQLKIAFLRIILFKSL